LYTGILFVLLNQHLVYKSISVLLFSHNSNAGNAWEQGELFFSCPVASYKNFILAHTAQNRH